MRRRKKYSCPNGCRLPARKKTIIRRKNGTYGFGYNDFNFCPRCGSLMPYTLEKIEQFFEVYHIHPQLVHSLELIYKSEYESAVREATVVVETFLRHESGLNTHGVDLVNKALGFKRKGETIINPPLIQINELKSESDWNEQDGIRNMCVGFFQGPRNLYQHNGIGSGVSNSLSIVIEASFLLTCIDGGSILRNGKWIPTRINYREIYKKMPKTIDRLRLLRDRLNHG